MERSLAYLRDQGYHCEVTERWNPYAKRRIDLFGFCDVLAIRRGEVLAVQTTSYSNVSSRVRKIAEHENTAKVREANIRIIVHGWNGPKLREVDVS